jgi:hypothetical protein
LEKHGPLATQAPKAFKQAGLLRASADAREQALIRAALLERGLEPGAGDGDARKKAAMRALDELLAQFPEDEEAWYARAQLGGGAGGFGGSVGGIPFYHALIRCIQGPTTSLCTFMKLSADLPSAGITQTDTSNHHRGFHTRSTCKRIWQHDWADGNVRQTFQARQLNLSRRITKTWLLNLLMTTNTRITWKF